jgi:hypothetical protein
MTPIDVIAALGELHSQPGSGAYGNESISDAMRYLRLYARHLGSAPKAWRRGPYPESKGWPPSQSAITTDLAWAHRWRLDGCEVTEVTPE